MLLPRAVLVLVLLTAQTSSVPPPLETEYETLAEVTSNDEQYESETEVTSHDEDAEVPSSRSRRWTPRIPRHFKHLYIHSGGRISNSTDNVNVTLEIGGSPLSSEETLHTAAHVVSIMVKNMNPLVFDTLARKGSAVGTFTREEKLIVYPVYAKYSNEGCGKSCSGNCTKTCTSDHRKRENLTGLAGHLAVVLDDNLMCTSRDPYRHGESILVHEFTHTIHTVGLSKFLKDKIHHAYLQAKANTTWFPNSYAMTNDKEYFAEAATVFFGVCHRSRRNAGGMNLCNGWQGPMCKTEAEGRARLMEKDPDLYSALVNIFDNHMPNITHGMKVCEAPDETYEEPMVLQSIE